MGWSRLGAWYAPSLSRMAGEWRGEIIFGANICACFNAISSIIELLLFDLGLSHGFT